MNPSTLYALGTLASWLGWFGVFRTLYLALRGVILRDANDSDEFWGRIAASAFFALIGLYASRQLLPQSGGKGVWLPLVWVMMPFSAWLAAIAFTLIAVRSSQAIMAVTKTEKTARLKAAAIWLAVGLLFAWLFGQSGDAIELLQGKIPLSLSQVLVVSLMITATLAVMVLSSRSALARGWAKATANHLALLAGSVVFGIPFAWLLITSFKEDRDMSSPNGLVWIPRVQETIPYLDPDEPIVEGTFEGEAVQGPIIEKLADGSARVEIDKPAVLRGLTFVAHPPLKIVPKPIPIVTAQYEGTAIRGKVVKELPDGQLRVEVMEPEAKRGARFDARPEAVTRVRPIGLKWMNYPEALDYLPRETNKGLVYLRNTLAIVVLNVLGTILSSSLVAYAFARLRFPGKNALFLLLLSTMMLPAAVTLIPQFLIFRSLGWIDTLRPLWVPAFLGSAFNIFLLRQFFMGIPLELEDAAKIDGCSYLRAFWQVMLPQVKPALAVVAIWTFMGSWNNFMGPLIYINSPENMPISYALQLFQTDRLAEPGLLMAFATMSMIPVLLVFFFAQKYFIEGVTLSGLGGR